MLALVWASNAVGASLPAGAVASTIYTYRQLTRRGTPVRVAAWLLVATGIVSAATLALLAVIGVQLRVMDRRASFWLQLPLGWAAWARLRHSPPFPHASPRVDIAKPSPIAVAIAA